MDVGARDPTKSVVREPGPSAARSTVSTFPSSGVYRRLVEDGFRFQFAQAVRLLELAFPEAPAPGETSRYGEVPIRFRPSPALVFPPTDIRRVETESSDQDRVHVVSTFLGLYGIDSPLPYHFYEPLAQESTDTAPHRAFLDIFNHRFYSFFYRAWKKYRPELHDAGNADDRHSRRFFSLAGVEPSHAGDELSVAPMRVAAQAGLLARQVRSAEGLEALIGAFFGALSVEVIENVPRWVRNPDRSGLGDEGLRLGQGEAIGDAVYDRSGKFRIRLGSMELEQYLALLPGREGAETLQQLVQLYVPYHLEYDVELTLSSVALPDTQLGGDARAQLGYTARLGEAQDPTMTRVVDYG